jgi:hypothetical protein
MTMANKNQQKPVKNYIDLLYMTPSVITAKDIAALLQDTKGITVQLWEEMNILELELSNENSIDFESLNPNFKDPSDSAFVKNRDIKTIFAISLSETDLNTVVPYFDQLVAKHGGFVCADSDDFNPVYSGSSKR